MCLLLKVKRPVPMRSMKKVFTRNSVLQIDQGQPEITPSVIEARNLSENTRVEQTHDGSGQPDERNSSSAHTVKEQHALEEHREIAPFNTNNEFNPAINEEDIDFNIPGLPHSTVKQLHGGQCSRLDSENRGTTRIGTLFNSTRPTTKSIIQSLQPRIERNDS